MNHMLYINVPEGDPDYYECEECNGTGHIYYKRHRITGELVEVSQEEFEELYESEEDGEWTVNEDDIETCEHCHGEGRIEEDEYTYDDYLCDKYDV